MYKYMVKIYKLYKAFYDQLKIYFGNIILANRINKWFLLPFRLSEIVALDTLIHSKLVEQIP